MSVSLMSVGAAGNPLVRRGVHGAATSVSRGGCPSMFASRWRSGLRTRARPRLSARRGRSASDHVRSPSRLVGIDGQVACECQGEDPDPQGERRQRQPGGVSSRLEREGDEQCRGDQCRQERDDRELVQRIEFDLPDLERGCPVRLGRSLGPVASAGQDQTLAAQPDRRSRCAGGLRPAGASRRTPSTSAAWPTIDTPTRTCASQCRRAPMHQKAKKAQLIPIMLGVSSTAAARASRLPHAARRSSACPLDEFEPRGCRVPTKASVNSEPGNPASDGRPGTVAVLMAAPWPHMALDDTSANAVCRRGVPGGRRRLRLWRPQHLPR